MSSNNRYKLENNSDLETINSFKILISNIKALKDKTWGCPWQKTQSHVSLIPFLYEESNEFIDAIYEKNANNICEELGDLLLQVMLHAEISYEEKEFTLNDVIKNLNKKIIYRHPYIFDKKEKVSLKKSQQIWVKIKNLEKEAPHMKSSISRGLNLKIKNLPPTVGTDKITNAVKKHGFKWESTDEIFKKLEEEINELKEAIKSKNDSEIKNEFGDIYFTLLNLSNFLKINPESALQKTNIKFLDRFSIIEEHAGDNIKKQTPKDFQRLWQIAKQKLARKIPKNK
ncbi:Nucleoside triphosphate pyrophosphohydrolase MazG [Prochlorococcus marinus str. MIT 9321]|uniref:Nucleoside triphosphate pyrophosphohydrolase MazG n=1 Tax=Prochlorococcus marinus str. MIT 9401 TaxID=167551 RepID=A0A0A2B849_PROMR|nr:nucleoside triphosphate pyrophosphohydrolase [Prochlorococcus marinus]KGG03260.1 Nucleoside triphosphate pyrophosphohydrolase MazG [Prochlorococcus marinus str. MIT 9321]KGG06434.1 Nucleoside triphosphate pyrophosphohydrolase MazG [Prochlorococcus marinus str. MIT 9322]KGG09327.1 Nucleoside triphosphate pyrophosphohydrolase MazG [Prochlorococcus marinus str. MIT 9401]